MSKKHTLKYFLRNSWAYLSMESYFVLLSVVLKNITNFEICDIAPVYATFPPKGS